MKKEIIKPFDLASYKNDTKVKTRNGHEVRIICTDVKGVCSPIIALVKIDDNHEVTMHYTPEGEINAGDISDNDLVIIEEVEKPEFWSDNKDSTFCGFRINNVASIAEVYSVHNTNKFYDVFATKKQAKSALAMARISQIMANDVYNFGGVITDDEWENKDKKFIIYRDGNNISKTSIWGDYFFLAFHTVDQRDLFLEKYRDLVKDYLMID